MVTQQISSSGLAGVSPLIVGLRRSRRIIAVAGAGISVSGGIPDFRSQGGIYDLVRRRFPELNDGQDLFDASLFRSQRTTQLFHTFIATLKDCVERAKPTLTHAFLKALDDGDKLLRVYTQNIDGLEAKAGLPSDLDAAQKDAKVVLLHGSLERVVCTLCESKHGFDRKFLRAFKRGSAPECPNCLRTSMRRAADGKRLHSMGILRPGIVLYNEAHPNGDSVAESVAKDLKKRPDCLIVLGTSLKVAGIKQLIKTVAKQVHHIGGIVVYINRTSLAPSEWKDVFDYHIVGDCDEAVAQLIDLLPIETIRKTKFLGPKPVQSQTEERRTCSIKLEDEGSSSFNLFEPVVMLPRDDFADEDTKANVAVKKRTKSDVSRPPRALKTKMAKRLQKGTKLLNRSGPSADKKKTRRRSSTLGSASTKRKSV